MGDGGGYFCRRKAEGVALGLGARGVCPHLAEQVEFFARGEEAVLGNLHWRQVAPASQLSFKAQSHFFLLFMTKQYGRENAGGHTPVPWLLKCAAMQLTWP
jgi:hypothetical protein